nr:retrovirus-related Pol polyprotein from transposon TNT 1-94 [Tanacetum cinerariifolium]
GCCCKTTYPPNEFDLWKMRIEQYFLMTDYSLWEVILNGDSSSPTRIVDGWRLGHANMRLIQSLASKELVRNLHKLKFDQHFCDACKIRKQARASHKAKNIVSTTRCLELLHMDLFGPSTIRSDRGNRYTLVIVDDYSRNVKESLNVTFDETPSPSKTSPLVDDDLDEEEAIKVTEKKNLENDIEDETLEINEIVNIKESRNHPLENVIGNLNQRTLRSQAQNQSQMLIEFLIKDQFFSYSLKEFAQILDMPCEGACVFIDRWSLDKLAYGVPSDGPYQTNLPFPDDIILTIRVDREERKTRKDHGTRRGRHSTSSSTFDQPSLSHLNDDDDDGNNEGTSRATLRWHFEEVYVTWTQFWKKRDNITPLHEEAQKLHTECGDDVVISSNDVKICKRELNRLKESLEDSMKRRRHNLQAMPS